MDTRFPPIIITSLALFAPVFSANHSQYFRGLVLAGMLRGQTRKCVTNIASVCFFVERYLAWVDTTVVSKVKGTMPGVQKWHDHSGNPARGAHLVGQHWAVAGLMGATSLHTKWPPLCFPLLATLSPGNTNPCGVIVTPEGVAQAMTCWEAVCPLRAHLIQMLGDHPLRVVADASFAKAPCITWMLSLSVAVSTRMRKDAVGWDDPVPAPPLPAGKKKSGRKRTPPSKGQVWKSARLVTSFPVQPVTVFLYGKLHPLQIVTRDLGIRDVRTQQVRVVVLKTKSDPLILLSTDLSLCPEEIIQLYARRCSLEIGSREAKHHCGLGQYPCTSFLAMTRFVGLRLVSLCLWRLTVLTERHTSWLQDQEKTSPLRFTTVSRAVRRFVIQRILQSSASSAVFQQSGATPEALLRLVA
jgi:hypothetical protein